MIFSWGRQNADYMTEKLNMLKRLQRAAAIADHITSTGHNINWEHFDI